MKLLSLVSVEFKKIRRSKILLILLAATMILWLPSIFNAHLNFEMQAEGISPENNFFIQGFLGMAWFMFPGSMVVSTVLLNQTERGNRGILKMLALPIRTPALCLSKFVVLLALAAAQIIMAAGMYFVSAAIVTKTQNYDFFLSPGFVAKETALYFLSAIPMLTFFWMLTVCIQTPIFSMGIGLASIVPSVLMINTKFWFAYPMCYPFYLAVIEQGKMAAHIAATELKLIPWIPAAAAITIFCLFIACLRFGQAERR